MASISLAKWVCDFFGVSNDEIGDMVDDIFPGLDCLLSGSISESEIESGTRLFLQKKFGKILRKDESTSDSKISSVIDKVKNVRYTNQSNLPKSRVIDCENLSITRPPTDIFSPRNESNTQSVTDPRGGVDTIKYQIQIFENIPPINIKFLKTLTADTTIVTRNVW